jgi:succinylglutamate desuccinylase
MSSVTQLFGPHSGWLESILRADDPGPRSLQLADGTRVTLPATGLIELLPSDHQHNACREALILSAGIHGNETAPIEILDRLLCELLEERWSLACPALLVLGNPPAMRAGTRFIDTNLNRLFNGAHEKPEYRHLPEAERAASLEKQCRHFIGTTQARTADVKVSHYDLHTAIRTSKREKFALYPYLPDRQVPREQLLFLQEADIDTLLLQHRRATTFSAFTAELGAESFTLELGKVMSFGKNDHSRFHGITNALRRRLSGGTPTPQNKSPVEILRVVHEIINTGEHFRLQVPDDAANFTRYDSGTLIWEDDRTGYRVGSQPEYIVFPNREVPVGQRAGLMLRLEPPASR